MNVGPTELLVVLFVLAVPIVVILAIVLLVRAGKRPCPACQKRVSTKATACPYCRTQIA